MVNIRKCALLAGVSLGLMLTAASAQEAGPYGQGYNAPPPPPDYGPPPSDDYGPPPPAYDEGGPPENVIVIAPPRTRTDHSSLAPTEITRLSMSVRYDDLDLRSADGARELRARVRDAARDVCERLVARFPHAMPNSPPCYRQALDSGMNRADTAIHEARDYAYYDDYRE